MLSTESFAGARALGEESLQMWDLNKRLEAYLARVKFLEEENEGLRAEIQSARGSPAGEPWRARYEEELRALRAALDRAFRDKCTAELARDNLYEEVQQVKSRCQKEQAARDEAKRQLALGRKELEEERRAQIWLKERAVQLEKEVEALLEVHEEEKAGLDQEIASFSQSLETFRCAPVAFQPVEVEDYSKRLSEIWRGAVETYKTEVSQLEGSLCQAKENLWKAVEDNQQSQLQLQHLEKDLAGLKARKEMLEENLARQWQEQRGEAEKFQLAMEALEQEKQSLRAQIAQVLEDRQQLMHLKMSLSLEVATYRTLLEAESTRLQMPAGEYKLANGLRDLKLEASGGSKLAPASTEPRRLLPRDPRASPSGFPRAEGRAWPARTQSDALTPKSHSPGARELPKIGSILHTAAPRAVGAAREPVAPSVPLPSLSQPGKAAPPLSPEPPSPVPRSPGGDGPAWPGGAGAEPSQGQEPPPPGAAGDAPDTCGLRYPAQLVSAALEDALKEMKDDAQPKEEPTLSAEWAPQDARAPSPVFPIEACGWAPAPAADEAGEGRAPSEGAGDGAGDAVLQGLRAESSALRDGAGSPPGPQLCGTGTAQSAAVSWDETRAWDQEMPTALSPGEPGAVAQEGDVRGFSPAGSSWEEPERGEDNVETLSTDTSQPSEDEEGRGAQSPFGEDNDQGEGVDVQDGESPQREIESAGAVPVERHPGLPTERAVEDVALVGGEQEPEHQEMSECDMDRAAEEEMGQEPCPEPEPLSTPEAAPAEEASPGAEEDDVGDEAPGRAESAEGEQGEAAGEVLGAEDAWAGEAVGPGAAGQERGAGEEPGELQEEGFAEEELEEPEPELGEEPWGGEDDGNSQKPHPEEWEVTAEDTEGALGTEEPAWVGDTPTSAEGLESEDRDHMSPAEMEETQEDDEGAGSDGSQQQPPALETEPAPGLGGDGQDGTAAPPGQDGTRDPAGAAEEPRELRDEDTDNEPSSELGQLERGSAGAAAPEQVLGDGPESSDSGDEDAEGPGEPEPAPGLEDTLPDSTPQRLYQGETAATAAPNPPVSGDTAETAPAAEMAPEGEGWAEGREKPATPPTLESCGEGAGREAAPGPDGAEEEEEEEEGYFIISAPKQEVSSSEEAEISEDFEEITVEAPEANNDDGEAPEVSPAPEDQGHLEAFAGAADEEMTAPPEEPEVPEDEDDAARLEEGPAAQDDAARLEEGPAAQDDAARLEEGPAAQDDAAPLEEGPAAQDDAARLEEGPAAQDDAAPLEEGPAAQDDAAPLEEGPAAPQAAPGSPGAAGPLAGALGEPAQGDTGAPAGPAHEGGSAAGSDEELDGAIEPESDAGRAKTLPGCTPGQEEDEEEEEEEEEQDEPGTAPAAPQAQELPGSPPPGPAQRVSDQQPVEQEAPRGDSAALAGDEGPPEPPPAPPGSAPQLGGFPEAIEGGPDAAALSAKLPADVVPDPDILEIVEQALEYNQELVMGARAAEGQQRDPSGTELPADAGEDSSPASSSQEEPTVQEAMVQEVTADAAPGTEAPVRAENGLHREASLEDLAEFTEEALSGIAGAPAAQELPTDATAPSAAPPPQPPAPGDAPAPRLPDATPLGKHGGADADPAPSPLGADVLCLVPQPPPCRLRAEPEPWALGDE